MSGTEREFTVIIERDEDGWLVGSIPQLHGCHTQGRSMDELMARVREAALLCMESQPAEPPLELVGVQRIQIER